MKMMWKKRKRKVMVRMNANERWWERKDWEKIVAMKEERKERLFLSM